MHGHGIGDERLGLPAAAPVLRLAHCRAPRAGVTGFDCVKTDAGDFHSKLVRFCVNSKSQIALFRAMDEMANGMDFLTNKNNPAEEHS
jgi:hypothetical protein